MDEVGASHVDADCVVHYGHTCLSPWVLFLFRLFSLFFLLESLNLACTYLVDVIESLVRLF